MGIIMHFEHKHNFNNQMIMKTYIWSLPTRLFHWLLVISLAGAYLLSEEDAYLNLHTAFGYAAGLLLIFRLIWGLIGPKYSRFSDFNMGLSSLKRFVKNIKDVQHFYAGHNPAASVIMLLIMVTGILVAFTGILTLSAEGQGFLTGFIPILNEETAKDLHEIAVNILIVLVAIHLAGITSDTLLHRKTGTLVSIFTGYKNLKAGNVKLTTVQKSFSFLWFVLPLIIFIYTLNNQNVSFVNKQETTEETESEEND